MIRRKKPLQRTPVRKRRSKPRRGRIIDSEYKAWVAHQACIVSVDLCRSYPVEVAHCGPRGLGQKCHDRECLPICSYHHRDPQMGQHGQLGARWWEYFDLDRDELFLTHQSRYTQATGRLPK